MLLRLILLAHIGAGIIVYATLDRGWSFALLAAPFGASLFVAFVTSVDMLKGVWVEKPEQAAKRSERGG